MPAFRIVVVDKWEFRRGRLVAKVVKRTTVNSLERFQEVTQPYRGHSMYIFDIETRELHSPEEVVRALEQNRR